LCPPHNVFTVCKAPVIGREGRYNNGKGDTNDVSSENLHVQCPVNTKIHVQCACRYKLYVFSMSMNTKG
jgi:hypothetical protein